MRDTQALFEMEKLLLSYAMYQLFYVHRPDYLHITNINIKAGTLGE